MTELPHSPGVVDGAASEDSFHGFRPWFLAIVASGMLARCTRYLAGWPLWGDETALTVNIALRDFAGLLQPLDVNQVAPVGFLYSVKASVMAFGLNTMALRLTAFVASLLVLPVVYGIARRSLRGGAVWIPVCLVAVAHFQIRHSSEVKQYALETLVTALMALLALDAIRGRLRSAWILVAVVPLALVTSLPAVFVGGGIALAALPAVVRRGSLAWWSWYVAYGLVLVGSFGLHYVLLLSQLSSVANPMMDGAWDHAFPNLAAPLSLPGWVLEAATGVMFAVPFGGEHGASTGTTILFVLGLVWMWRNGQRDALLVLFGTIAVALVAAAARKYPFAGHARMAQYLLPLICVPIAAGVVSVVEWLRSGATDGVARVPLAGRPVRVATIVCSVLLTCGLANVARDLVRPYHGETARLRDDFARWLWQDYGRDGNLICVDTGWHARFRSRGGPSRHHACFRELYGADVPVAVDPVPKSLGGRTGLVVSSTRPENSAAALAEWLRALGERHEVVSAVTLPVNTGVPFPRAEEYYVVWVEPKKEDASHALPLRTASDGPDTSPR